MFPLCIACGNINNNSTQSYMTVTTCKHLLLNYMEALTLTISYQRFFNDDIFLFHIEMLELQKLPQHGD